MAVRFDGVDDVLECAAETTLRYEYTQAFSGHAWVRKFDITGNCIIGKAQNSPPAAQQRGWAFNTEVVDGQNGISFHLVNNGSSAHMFAQAQVPMTGTLVPGLWTPVGFTYDGSGLSSGVTFYINGKSVGFFDAPIDTLGGNTILVNGTPLRIGGFDTEFWHGDACGVTLVPGELTSGEMADLADIRNLNTDPATFLTTADPDVWLPLRDDAGSIDLTDYSGNGHDASVSTGAPAVLADPTVVMDTFTTLDLTGDNSVTLTPNGHLEGVAVLIGQNVSSADLIAGVTHGGDALTRLATDGLAQDTAGEPGAAYAYLKTSGVQQGAQTVAVDVASGTDAKRAFVVGLNAVGTIAVTDSDRVQGDTANPSVTLGTTSGWAGLGLNVCFSGQNAPGSLTAPSGWIKLGGGRDFGSQAAVAAAANLEGASIASGWTATSEDVAMIAVALTAVASVAYSLDCQPGTFAVTGTSATIAATRVLSADPGSYTVTGTAATVVAARSVSADAGTYAVTGADASFLSTGAVLADPGVVTVTGTAATVAAARNMAVDPGSYAVTGADADLVFQVVGSYTISAQPGVLTVSGADAITAATRTISLTPGTYAVTGIDATFLNSRALVADPATYTVTGSAMTGTATRTIDAEPGNVSFTGVSAGIGSLFDIEIDAQPGSVTISGTASLTWVPGRLRNTTRGGRIRWNRTGRITQTKEGAVT